MLYHFCDYTLDEARRELRRTGQLVAVERKVFQVLLYLLQHRDRVVSKEELLEQCWSETFVSEAALTRCLTKLRKVVQADHTAPPVIKTLHAKGIVALLMLHSYHPRRLWMPWRPPRSEIRQ
jgi:DNA-binding winged helix-turn-helix (wHTH) protein